MDKSRSRSIARKKAGVGVARKKVGVGLARIVKEYM